MFGKKILFLTAGYVAWNIVALLYKGKKKTPTHIKNKKDAQKVVENFLEIQKNFVQDIEMKFLSESGREKLSETKEKFRAHASDYFSEGEKLLQELQISQKYQETKTRWLSLFENLKNKAQSLYRQALEEEQKLESTAQETMKDWASRVRRAKEELTKKK